MQGEEGRKNKNEGATSKNSFLPLSLSLSLSSFPLLAVINDDVSLRYYGSQWGGKGICIAPELRKIRRQLFVGHKKKFDKNCRSLLRSGGVTRGP